MKRPQVSLVRCGTYALDEVRAAVRGVLAPLGGIGAWVRPGMRVLLKPNLLMRKHPDAAVTTHPVLVAAVAELVRDAGGRVLIADSPGGAYTERVLRGVYGACGMDETVAATGAELNLDTTARTVANPQAKYLKQLRLLTPVADADLVINLPKLKTHGQMVYTGAVKNLFGTVPGEDKSELHLRLAEYERFADALVDVYLAARPGLTIMDAVVGMEGAGPSAGDPRAIGLILAAPDAFALDLAALHIIGAPAARVPVLHQAMQRGLCPTAVADLECLGEPLDACRVAGFRIPHLNQQKSILFFENRFMQRISQRLLKPSPVVQRERCVGCGDCARSCPAKVIAIADKKAQIDLHGCIRCFCCQELCPVKAIEIVRPRGARFIQAYVGPAVMRLSIRHRFRRRSPGG